MHINSDDPFFAIPQCREWNAVIGRQGCEENYVDGYLQAAIELAELVIERKLYDKRDTLIMPILFNARHSIELLLKYVIARLSEVGVLGACRKNHDILSYWRLLDANVLGDEALRQQVMDLEPFVTSLAKVDDDGQEFRYSENRLGNKSLEKYSLANILVIRSSLGKLGDILGRLQFRVICLAAERRTGSFTQECSRCDLKEIARMLPTMSEWRTSCFVEAKASAMERFNLSGRKFSTAVEVIKDNRELGNLIGIEREMLHLRDESALFVMQ